MELHLYADGGHGFGHRAKNQGPVSHWMDRFSEWLVLGLAMKIMFVGLI